MTAIKFGFEIPDWHDDAACRVDRNDRYRPDFFDAYQAAAAKRICNTCPVVEECLRTALETPWLLGVWGGTTERQRLAIRRKQAGAAA